MSDKAGDGIAAQFDPLAAAFNERVRMAQMYDEKQRAELVSVRTMLALEAIAGEAHALVELKASELSARTRMLTKAFAEARAQAAVEEMQSGR